MAVAEIKHAIKRAEQWVELVGAEQHRDAQFLLQRPRQLDHRRLMMRVEADQRLVQQQQARPASSACASSRRCRSPPEVSASGRRASSVAWTSSSAQRPPCARHGPGSAGPSGGH